ncbi:MAG: hypothetical protein HC821_03715 [Lewinella sp.]|nr:hypothetical protein [Lewinella sp.]
MHDVPGAHEKQKAAKIRLKPERDPVLRPTFATSRICIDESGLVAPIEIENPIGEAARLVSWMRRTVSGPSTSYSSAGNDNNDLFTPPANQLTQVQNLFSVTHSINNCVSDTSDFAYEVLSGLSFSLNQNVIGADDLVLNAQTGDGVAVDELVWSFILGADTSTLTTTDAELVSQ